MIFIALVQKIINTEEKRRLASNIFSLGVLQGINYILPLLTVPYLVRVLGPEYLGLLAFASATLGYFTLVTDYGFNLSATRQVSIYRDNKDKINEIFSSVMIIKTALLLGTIGLMVLLVFNLEKFSFHRDVYFITFGTVIGQVLFPQWLFQGMERMRYITYFNVGAKAFFTVCIFFFVREQADYLFVPLLTTLGYIVVGIWSMYLVKKEFDIRFIWQTKDSIKFQLREGWHVFLSSMAISLYTISTTFILGLFTNNLVVGYYAGADKIVQAVKGLYAPVSQAFYPLVSKKFHDDRKSGLAYINKITLVMGTFMFVVSAVLFLFAESIVSLLLGDQYQQSILILQIMAFVPFLIALSNIYGIQTMLNLGYKQAFSRILVFAAVIGVFCSLVLVPIYEGLGTAVTLLGVELYVTVVMYLFLKIRLRRQL